VQNHGLSRDWRQGLAWKACGPEARGDNGDDVIRQVSSFAPMLPHGQLFLCATVEDAMPREEGAKSFGPKTEVREIGKTGDVVELENRQQCRSRRGLISDCAVLE
jgi:hypothetical protein